MSILAWGTYFGATCGNETLNVLVSMDQARQLLSVTLVFAMDWQWNGEHQSYTGLIQHMILSRYLT